MTDTNKEPAKPSEQPESPQTPPDQKKQPVVVATTLDVSVDRLPNTGVTLEEYRRQGGVEVAPPQDLTRETDDISGSVVNGHPSDLYPNTPITYERLDGSVGSSRSTHAVTNPEPEQ